MPEKVPVKLIVSAYSILFRFSYGMSGTRKRIISPYGISYTVDRLSIYDRNELYYLLENLSLYDL